MRVLGGNRARPRRLPDPSPVLDKSRAHMGPEILSSTGAGVWRKDPMACPDSSSVLDKFRSASKQTLFARNMALKFCSPDKLARTDMPSQAAESCTISMSFMKRTRFHSCQNVSRNTRASVMRRIICVLFGSRPAGLVVKSSGPLLFPKFPLIVLNFA